MKGPLQHIDAEGLFIHYAAIHAKTRIRDSAARTPLCNSACDKTHTGV